MLKKKIHQKFSPELQKFTKNFRAYFYSLKEVFEPIPLGKSFFFQTGLP